MHTMGRVCQARLVFSVLFTVLLWRMAAFAVGSEYIVGFAQAIGADPANNLASIVGRIVPQIVFWGMIVLFLTILNMIRRHHRQVTELHIQLLAETDQRMIQEALRFNYEEATESLGMAMYAMDRLGRFTYANPRFQTRFAVPLMEIIGKSWLEFMPKREAQVYENSERRVLGGTSTYQGYEPNPFGGGVVWASKSPIRGADGSVSGLVGVFIEGTPLARYHAQLALASSEPLNGLAMRNQYWQQGAVLDKRGDAQGLLRINFPYVPTVVELLSAMAAIHSAYAHIEFFLNATVAALETVDSVIESDDPTSVIARVRFDSPGFFEILAKMNPLKIIVDHLEFRQKHKETVKLNKPKIKKLHADAIRAEMEANESAMKTELIRNKVIKERLKMLEEQGVPADVRQKLLLRFVTSKLDIVGDYQEKGLIGVTTIIDSPSSALHDDHVIDE
jgi:PAS domain S-box-containing protein